MPLTKNQKISGIIIISSFIVIGILSAWVHAFRTSDTSINNSGNSKKNNSGNSKKNNSGNSKKNNSGNSKKNNSGNSKKNNSGNSNLSRNNAIRKKNRNTEVAMEKINVLFSNIFDAINNGINADENKQNVINAINDTFYRLQLNNTTSIRARNGLNSICENNNLDAYNFYINELDIRVNSMNQQYEKDIKIISDNIKDFVLYVLYNYFCDGDKFNIERLRDTIIKTIEYYYNVDYNKLSNEQKSIIRQPILKFLEFSKN